MGGAVDPETGMLYIPSTTAHTFRRWYRWRSFRDAVHRGGAARRTTNIVGGLPLIKGPYGRIRRFNLNTGDRHG